MCFHESSKDIQQKSLRLQMKVLILTFELGNQELRALHTPDPSHFICNRSLPYDRLKDIKEFRGIFSAFVRENYKFFLIGRR
jgi:hypothetical protein